MTLPAAPVHTDPASDLSTFKPVLDGYDRVVFQHSALERAMEQVRLAVAPGMPPRIVPLFGPSDVGKTTLIEALKSHPEWGHGKVVHITCPPVRGRQAYDFGKEHWRLFAKAAGDSFPDDHVSPDAARARLHSGRSRRDGVATIDEYRLGVLEMLRARGVGVVVLDEAQHMTRAPSARSQADQLDVVKDCVDRTGIPHVLAGTYEMSVMLAASDQLGRRSIVVHFPPYDLSDAAGREAFQRIFGQLVGALPIADPSGSWEALQPHLRDVFVGSCGCVGTVKHWLRRALQTALYSGVQRVDWSLMETCRLPDETLYKMADAIRAFRKLIKPTSQEIEAALGLTSASSTPEPKSRSSRPLKPGRRAPHRDPVGLPSEREAS